MGSTLFFASDDSVVLFLSLNYFTDINLAKGNKTNCQRDLTKIKNSAILESLKIKTPTLFSQLFICVTQVANWLDKVGRELAF
jgi:hypothetical protein